MVEYQLTPEELTLIEQTNLATTEKFVLRITLFLWRILIHIAENYQSTVENLSPEQVLTWMLKDAEIRRTQGEEQAYLKWSSNLPDLDFPDLKADLVSSTNLTSHEKFLARLLISAPQLLVKVAQEFHRPIQSLCAKDIIQAIERNHEYLNWQS